MKPYPLPDGRARSRNARPINKKLILFLLFILLAILSFSQSGSGGGRLSFRNPTLESGTDKSDNAVYRFSQVESDFDALVKIKQRSSALVYLVTIDMTSSGFDKAFQPQVGYDSGSAKSAADWWMDFEMTLVKRGTSTPITFDNFNLSAIDIDGNGDKIKEYVTFYGLNGYTLEATSVLAVSNILGLVNGVSRTIGTRFDGPTTNFQNIDTSGTSVMVTSQYVNTQKFTIRVGGVASGANGASERMYSLYFQSFQYTAPTNVTLPVDLKNFDAKLSSGKAILNWTSTSETGFSHFIVQHSIDGKTYSDATLIFANGGNAAEASYSYSESFLKGNQGLVYYRLKMVDADGRFKYSQVRILKLDNNKGSIAITTYPNPVESELRITIPDSWQSKKVIYDMYAANGRMVKRLINERASQTEVMQMGDMFPGTYVVRLSSGGESAVQQIVKSR